MSDDSDASLLHRFVAERDEGAFAVIVRRHLDGVYSAALRRVGGDAQFAEDVAQQVFVALARKAAKVAGYESVTGWLYAATRHEAANVVRSERRRKVRDSEAYMMNDFLGLAGKDGEADWARVAPVLDAAIDELSEKDRAVILARFVEGRAFGEMGAALRISEDAARMRVERALEKLRDLLARRGVTSTGAALGVALANQAVVAAPIGLAETVVAAVNATVVGVGAATWAAGAVQFVANTKLAVGVAAVLAVVLIVVGEAAARRDAEQALAAADRVYEMHRVGTRNSERRTRAAEQAVAELAKQVDEAKDAAARTAGAVEMPAQAPQLSPSAEGKLFLARHPEVNAALIEWTNASVRGEWASFIKAHGLTGARLDEFCLIIGMGLDPGPGPDGKELMLEAGPRLRLSERDRRLQVLLGQAGPALVDEFWRLQPARSFADRVTEALCFSEAPLLTAQREQLVQILDRNPATGAEAASVKFDWDGVIAQSQGVLSASQRTVLEGLRTEDRRRQALDRVSRSMAK